MNEPSTRRAAEDQLPTSRLPPISPPLPPPVPPPGPAHTTQRLRALTEGVATKKASPPRWRDLVARMTSAAVVPARIVWTGGEPWSQRRAGLACAFVGAVLIAGAIALGWVSVAGVNLDRIEPVGLAIAIVIARATLAIATMATGYGVLRVGERLAFPAARSAADERRQG
jgi:hypothetical protein